MNCRHELDRPSDLHQQRARNELHGHRRDPLQPALLPLGLAVMMKTILSPQIVRALGLCFMTTALLSCPVWAATLTSISSIRNAAGFRF